MEKIKKLATFNNLLRVAGAYLVVLVLIYATDSALYRYSRLEYNAPNRWLMVKINRVTGRVVMLDRDGGWRLIEYGLLD